jgi:hypothetical protein
VFHRGNIAGGIDATNVTRELAEALTSSGRTIYENKNFQKQLISILWVVEPIHKSHRLIFVFTNEFALKS